MTAAMAMASLIASKSPVAVTSTKHNLVYSRDHSVDEGLNYMVRISAEQYTGFVIIPQYYFPTLSNLYSNRYCTIFFLKNIYNCSQQR